MNGPVLDPENELNKTLTAFNKEDVSLFFGLGRRIKDTAILAGAIGLPVAVIILGWKVLTA